MKATRLNPEPRVCRPNPAAFGQSDESSPGCQPMGGCRGLPVQEGHALQLDVDVVETLRAENDRRRELWLHDQ